MKKTFREGLRKNLKLGIIGLLIITIIEVVILAKEIKEKMHTPCKSRWSQPLLDSEDSDEELVDDEQKKERKKDKSQGVKWWILMKCILSKMS